MTSANVACGYHAGTAAIMRRVCAEAARLGVAVGAQVSYADREHFGRVALDVRPTCCASQVADQVRRARARSPAAAGTAVRYLKPHGALYHRVARRRGAGAAVLDGSGALPVLGMPGGVLALAAAAGRAVLHEGFPDRGYADDGRLVPRDRARRGARRRRRDRARAVELARPRVDSVCVHGDTPGAVATRARRARGARGRGAGVCAGVSLSASPQADARDLWRNARRHLWTLGAPFCGRHLWDQRNVPSSVAKPLRGALRAT